MGSWPVGPPRHGERAYLPTRALVQRALTARWASDIGLDRRALSVEDMGERVRVTFERDHL